MCRTGLFAVTVVAAVSILPAQESDPVVTVVQDTMNISTLTFDRILETFLWTGRVRFERDFGGTIVDLDQRLMSRVIKTGRLNIQDELDMRLGLAVPIDGTIGLRSLATSTVVTDNKQIDLGNLSQHQVLAGASFQISPPAFFAIMGGYETASQQGVRDRGVAALLEMRADPLRVDEFDIVTMGRFGRSWLDPRKLESDSVKLSVSRVYGGAASNRLSLLYTRLGREFYTKADAGVEQDFQTTSNIFRRTAQELAIADTLRYETPSAMFHVFAGIGNRTINRAYRYKSFSDPANAILDVEIRDSRVFGGADVRTRLFDWLTAGLRAEFEEREERHAVRDDPSVPRQTYDRQNQSARRLTNAARRTTVGADFGADLGRKDALNLSGSASILRYDTPDTLNTDDRDELLILVAVEEVHRFDKTLTASVLAEATLGHLVYLNRFQSANNSWNRIFRFRPKVTFAPEPWLISVNTAEVLANYTVYDFDEQIQSVRSFSFRQASWTDSTSIRIGTSVNMVFHGTLRMYERGILKWDTFRERPESFFIEESYWPQVSVGVTDHLMMGVGYRYFSQTRFRYEGRDRKFDRSLVNAGPTVTLAWYGSGGGRISVEGWRETQTVSGRSRSYSNLSLVVGMIL